MLFSIGFSRRTVISAIMVCLLAVGISIGFHLWERGDKPDPRLEAFVQRHPPVDIIFTSRSEPASFEAAAPEGEVYTYPGQPLWQAREGRLRRLSSEGKVFELTWGKSLPDGSTLIDVMSPAVSADGKKVIFAGRKSNEDRGHFRLYEVNVNGTGLRQLTGGSDDIGCVKVPPMRYGVDGKRLSDLERRRIDFDDVDPVYLPGGRIGFVSTRRPDLGRGHSRRASHIWMMRQDGDDKRPLSANRNNDRWPYFMQSGFLTFSLWSRNTEVVTSDRREVLPFDPDCSWATVPTNGWFAAVVDPASSLFGALVKVNNPVWRPRPLFNGRIAYMTPSHPGSQKDGLVPSGMLQVEQAKANLITTAPSATPAGYAQPRRADSGRVALRVADGNGHLYSFATPSPCPVRSVVLAGAAFSDELPEFDATQYGIYIVNENWKAAKGEVLTADQVGLKLLFDDPDFVDAEPVAVYRRPEYEINWEPVPATPGNAKNLVPLAGGERFQGPLAQLESESLYSDQVDGMSGNSTDIAESPIFSAPPNGSIAEILVYASYRDRFDDPDLERIKGGWELVARVPIKETDGFDELLPAGVPIVLAGVGKDGRVVEWESISKDSTGFRAKSYAFAGDHYSALKPMRYHFCIGCHPGHSQIGTVDHREQWPP